MRRLTCVLLVIVAVSVMGCSSHRQPVVTAPKVTESGGGVKPAVPDAAPAPDPAPAPAPTVPSDTSKPVSDQTICEPVPVANGEYRRREERLFSLLKTALHGVGKADAPEVIRRAGDCLKVDPVADSAGNMLVVRFDTNEPEFTRRYGVAVWQHEGEWKAASLLTDEIGNGLVIKRLRETDAGFEVTALFQMDGTGHYGGFQFYRFGTEMSLLWSSPTFDHFGGQLLGDRVLLGTYRDGDIYNRVHYYAANCCYPTTSQSLWERQGDQFVEKAVRTYPSVLYTVSAFVGAWNQNKLDMAGSWAVNQQVIPQMLGGAKLPPAIGLTNEPAGLYDIERAEAAYWDALPIEFRGPAPTVTEFVWPATPQPLLLKRINGQWRVAGWR